MVLYKFQGEAGKAEGLKDKSLHTEQLNAYIHARQLLPPSLGSKRFSLWILLNLTASCLKYLSQRAPG